MAIGFKSYRLVSGRVQLVLELNGSEGLFSPQTSDVGA